MVTVRVARAAVGEVHWFHGSLLLSDTPRCRGGYTASCEVFLRTRPVWGYVDYGIWHCAAYRQVEGKLRWLDPGRLLRMIRAFWH